MITTPMSFLDAPSKAFQGGQKGGSETFEKGKNDKPFSEFLSFTKERYPQTKSVEPPKGSKAVREFMDSFESEFGIPPQKILRAMAKMNPEQLDQPVEKTAQLIMNDLDLDPKDQDKAMAMYMQMLGQWKQHTAVPTALPGMENTQELTGTVATASMTGLLGLNALESGASITRPQNFEAATASQAALEGASVPLGFQKDVSSVMLQNGSSVLQDPYGLTAEPPIHGSGLSSMDSFSPSSSETAMNSLRNAASNFAEKKIQSYKDLADSTSSTDLQKLKEVLGKFDDSTNALQSKIQSLEASTAKEGSASLASAMVEQESLRPIKAQMQSLSPNLVDVKNSSSMMEQLLDGPSSTEKVVELNASQGAGADSAFGSAISTGLFAKGLSEEKSESEELIQEEGNDLYSMSNHHLEKPMRSADVDSINAAFMDTNPLKPGASPQDPNIQNILKQAQYAINKGGGEARVQMNPEGMGQVNLHVAIRDGKISLQMEAETPEAKKLIESSINDLKDSLRLHRLSVEQVKIDVIQSTNTDTGTQFSNSSHQGQESSAFQNSSDFGRNQSRQFWDQFRDDRPGQRTQFFESPALKRYAERPRDPVTKKEHQPKPRSVQGKGTGLNVVA